MNYQTTQIYNLMRYEFTQVEGDFASLRESDVKSVIPAGICFADFLEQLRSGHQVLLTDVPSIPLLIRDRDEWGNQYWRVNPAVESHLDLLANKAYTARVEWVNHGIGSTYSGSVNASVYTEPYVEREPVKLTLAERLSKQRQERLRELDKIPLPSSAWQNAFNKPPVKPSRFAKSALVPNGTCDIGTQREPLSALGDYAAYTLAVGQGISAASGEAFLTRIGGAALAELPGLALKIVGRAGMLAAFVPNKLADSTLYSAADMRNKTTVETNIRLGFNADNRIYGYHVNGANIPKREVKRVGERFAVELEPDITIEWVPISGDFGGKPILVNPIPEMEKFDIWIHPQAEQGQEFDNTYITPIADAELQDYILTFPAETGLPPLYVVYKESPRNESGIVTGNGEDITGQWLEAAGKELGSPVPSQIADQLRGREFSSFDGFRKAFWKAVSRDEVLSSQFNEGNQELIRNGFAPFPRFREQVGGREKYEIHHVEEIQHGGSVYDVDNMTITTPKNHIRIHSNKR
ncbi:S-type pyocin domain-containing protein [Vibrio rhizosphaerae]|uniref:S-type pyocin domain-containing protein n=1 Tax=Vibrio rhizosphaerae TaxID=398736 RepID=A0ABU4IV59_9VIBR|nr:S-type pyocin domain-containing protein [Vibrio rhizosphaerae]MDW6093302.1 S-type pyocin domain-containing protein [Vibrio rhizosphaerae]